MDKSRELKESREGLLRTRRSLEDFENYRSSDEISLNDLQIEDEDPFEDRSHRPFKAYSKTSKQLLAKKETRGHIRRVLYLVAALAAFWLVLAISGYYIDHVAPIDGKSEPWYPTPAGGTVNSWEKSYVKAAKLVEKMSLVEKVNITTGTGWSMGLAVGNTAPALEAGFPGLALQDGPLGIRFSDNTTAFPAGLTVGATWNKKLMYERGQAHGLEARLKGINVLLGPCVGPLGRMPAGGRNWEGFGADPYLQGVAGAETVKGIQSQGVIATIKHYIGNEQEHFRQSREWALKNALSSNIGDRTLHELYLWPFADAVKAGVGSVMCSYQMTNNSYSCGNSKLLNGILKDELGFQGFVMSDWLAQRSGVSTALSGLDMSMPGDGLGWQDGKSLWGPELTRAVLNTSIPIARLNDMVTRVVAAWYQMGQDDKKLFDRKGPNFSSWTNDEKGVINFGSPDDKNKVIVNQYIDVQGEGNKSHSIIARQIAAEGTVLLKNDDNTLPLDPDGWPRDAVQDRKWKVGIFGEDAGEGKGANFCKDRACNQGTLASGWGSGAVEFPYLITPIDMFRHTFNDDTVAIASYLSNDHKSKVDNQAFTTALHDRDMCLVFANADSGEGYVSDNGVRGDRNNLKLQKGGDVLISTVAELCGGGNSPVVVIIHSVGPVLMESWIDLPNVKAVIMAHLPGQESGNALADILFGKTNPSGKLPYTIGKTLDCYGEGGKVLYFPNGVTPQQDFKEGIYIDYRHFDKFGITPRYEFGFGLSYTQFEYTNLEITPLQPKSRLPAPRISTPAITPPKYDETLPDPKSVLFPEGFRKLERFIYPYLPNLGGTKPGKYKYPEGYDIEQRPSQAGGGEGGNPSLWENMVRVSLDVTNAGSRNGSEVVQLYISYPKSVRESDIPRANTTAGKEANKVAEEKEASWNFDTDMTDFPVKVLRGFEKVFVAIGTSERVEFNLTRRDLSYWDTEVQNWVLPVEGTYRISIGKSSRNLVLEGEF